MIHYCTFSEAIRDGAKLRPQAYGVLMDEFGKTCAIGAGLHAMYLDELMDGEIIVTNPPIITAGKEFKYLITTKIQECPHYECPHYRLSKWKFWEHRCDWGKLHFLSLNLLDTIWHLNDSHHWSREKIADWLEAEEDKLGYITLIESEPEPKSIEPTEKPSNRCNLADV